MVRCWTSRAPGALRCSALGLVLAWGFAGPISGQAEARLPPLPRLHLLPTTEVLSPWELAGAVGQTSTFGRGIREGGAGSGNQTYQVFADLGLPGGLMAHAYLETNDDPTYGPVEGRTRAKEFFSMGGSLRARIGEWGPVRFALEGTLARLGVKSEAGLFAAENDTSFARQYFTVASLSGMVSTQWAGRWRLTFVPSLASLPDHRDGVPFYRRSWRLGAGVDGDLIPEVRLFATGELPLGPGANYLDGDGRFHRIPTWSAGVSFVSSPRVQLTTFLTNQAGAAPPTRHLTLVGAVPVQWGARLRYTLSRPSGRRRSRILADAPPGSGSAELTVQGPDTRTLAVGLLLAPELRLELGLTRTPGLGSAEALGIDLDQGTHFRLGASLAVLHQDAGAPVTLVARTTVGQDVDSQQGYLLAEVAVERDLAHRVSLRAATVATLNGGTRPMALELEAVVGEPEGWQARARPTLLLRSMPSLWTAAIRTPSVGPLRLEAFLTTARSTLGMGRLLGDPDRPAFGASLRVRLP